ncbi:undecaprenyl-phosphate alpha-N-acetylglucosaminyl 1-phosphate transferase [Bacillus canaveralius]|uniref:Undecaprenyl-phosphate alpha-N-acetylglucosaminyl 1-phosphate transferase n=1 Tax=Bacillus canaveralius TaxID=1403243 RepID=A0A2N5GMI3_9BACI|nr:MraY family glycosyltransferase [Bacillus canaveralius]PLR83147.1 undecaprenyl-phosphate alpha-N-acetylglucosaminyl 1-phosphate transferase [Bacillus canaveralius]PLR94065.1 undecaprenyl-phosphate alpha-N-acetylglucosaminyl 1-phosphate transferase [Bacillus canaveralius]RSK54134.1 undecaprenyl/decaprenyl-phosphate alpha-N-acetylglucosaminyl 1-phosphate transferase [Bacillus canaveralius]
MLYLTLLICFLAAMLLTPIIKKLAFKIGATDRPNQRKVHQKIMPRLGGLAIFISFLIGITIIKPNANFPLPLGIDIDVNNLHLSIVIGSLIIILTGVFDDIKEISPKVKLLGQIIASFIVVGMGGLRVEFVNLPFGGELDFGYLSIPMTMLWIIGITNAINLIDGLDGLAAGVSSIALFTIGAMAMVMGNPYVGVMAFIVAVSTLGFLLFNFHPAKIFMGDTGALFLGFIIAVLSLLGFKNVTFISLVIPVIILGVPISDTLFAIIRRFVNKQPLSAPDKSHLHHCLIKIGYSHQQSVLLIYAMSAVFGLAAFIFSQATLWGSLIILLAIIITVEVIVEKIGLIREDYKPLLKFIKGLKPVNLRNKL